AGLDHPRAGLGPQGEVGGREGEADGAGLAGLERDPAEAAELLHRARDRGYGIAHVELDDFLAGTLAGVGHRDRDGDGAAVRRDVGAVERELAVAEGGVAEAVSERPERAGWLVAPADRVVGEVLVGRAPARH